MLTLICLYVTYQRDGNILIRQSVLPPGIISEVQDSPISLDFTVHPRSTQHSVAEGGENPPKSTAALTNTPISLKVTLTHGLAKPMNNKD